MKSRLYGLFDICSESFVDASDRFYVSEYGLCICMSIQHFFMQRKFTDDDAWIKFDEHTMLLFRQLFQVFKRLNLLIGDLVRRLH